MLLRYNPTLGGIQDGAVTVLVLRVRHRKEVYR
jgi:hypothetical protein